MTTGGHEPRVHAAVCLWLRRGSRGYQLGRAGLSVGAAAGPLLRLRHRPARSALPALTAQTQVGRTAVPRRVWIARRRCATLLPRCRVGVLRSDSLREAAR